jgi:hypothetical protein
MSRLTKLDRMSPEEKQPNQTASGQLMIQLNFRLRRLRLC